MLSIFTIFSIMMVPAVALLTLSIVVSVLEEEKQF